MIGYTIKEIFWGIYNVLLNGFYYCRFYLMKKKLFSHPLINNVEKDGWELTFQDEFKGTEIDWTKWNKWYSTHTQHKPGDVAGEPSLECIEVKDDKLHLYIKDNPNGDYPLKVGWMHTGIWEDIGFAQQFGYFEIRCKPPKQGLKYWPAFWLLGKDWPPEIDIFEFMSESDVGKDYTKGITFTDHFGNPGKKGKIGLLGTQLGRHLKGINWNEEFHTYACKWQYDYVEFYIDNVAVYRIIYNVPDSKMSITLNTAGRLSHLPTENDFKENPEFVIDYIRAYEKIY